MYKGLKPAGKHLALLWQCCCLPVYTRFQARGKAFGIVCCPCLPVYTWFQARGKAFGIVVTTLLSSRLHLIPSPAGKHYELYSVLILFPLFSSSFFSLHFFPPFPFWFPASFSVSRGHQVPRFHIFSTPGQAWKVCTHKWCHKPQTHFKTHIVGTGLISSKKASKNTNKMHLNRNKLRIMTKSRPYPKKISHYNWYTFNIK